MLLKSTLIELVSTVKGIDGKVFITVFSPISGQSKRMTPLISGQFFFHRLNYGQSLIKKFLKGGQVISGHSN